MDEFTQLIPYDTLPQSLRLDLPICESVRIIRLKIGQSLSVDSILIKTSINGPALKVQIWVEAGGKDNYATLYNTITKQFIVLKLLIRNFPMILFVNCGSLRGNTVVQYQRRYWCNSWWWCCAPVWLNETSNWHDGDNIFCSDKVNLQDGIKFPDGLIIYFVENGDNTITTTCSPPCSMLIPCFGCWLMAHCFGHTLSLAHVENMNEWIKFGNPTVDFIATAAFSTDHSDSLNGGIFAPWQVELGRTSKYYITPKVSNPINK